jgi:hypothetical protein
LDLDGQLAIVDKRLQVCKMRLCLDLAPKVALVGYIY